MQIYMEHSNSQQQWKTQFHAFCHAQQFFLPKMLHSHNSNHRHQFCQNLVVTKDSERFAVLKLEWCASNWSRYRIQKCLFFNQIEFHQFIFKNPDSIFLSLKIDRWIKFNLKRALNNWMNFCNNTQIRKLTRASAKAFSASRDCLRMFSVKWGVVWGFLGKVLSAEDL